MKKIFIILLSFSLVAITAQTKKTTGVKKTPPKTQVTSTTPKGFVKMLGQNIDEVMPHLEELLNSADLKVYKLKEEKTYQYDENFNKKESIDFKEFFFYLDSENNDYLTLRAKDNLINMVTINSTFNQKLADLAGVSSLKTVDKTQYESFLENEKTFAVLKTDPNNYKLTLYQKYSNDIDNAISIDSINLKTNFSETRKSIINWLGKKYPYLFSSYLNVYNDSNYQFETQNQLIYFKNGVSAFIYQEKNSIPKVTINLNSALQTLALKNQLGIDTWELRYTDKLGQTFYRKNNQMVVLQDTALEFFPVPDKNDTDARLSYSSINFEKMIFLFNNFSLEDRLKYVDDFYLGRKRINKDNQIIDSPSSFMGKINNELLAIYIADEKDYAENRGLIFLVDSYAKKNNEFFKSQMPESIVSQDWNMGGNYNGISRTQFYIKEKYLADKSADEEKERIANEEKRRANEAYQRRQEEKAARTAETVSEVTNALINAFKK